MRNEEIGVVIQVSGDSQEVHHATLSQVHNLQNALPGIKIDLVVHSRGINLVLKNNRLAPQLKKLVNDGIGLKVCENTMKSLKLEKSDLLPFAGIIPSAVAYIVTRQQEGWSYLKAGF